MTTYTIQRTVAESYYLAALLTDGSGLYGKVAGSDRASFDDVAALLATMTEVAQ